MPDAHRPASVDVNLLRSMRQAESSPFEQAMIWLANASVAMLVVAVLFFTILSKLPDRPRRKPAAAPAAPAAAKGERRKDGVYTAAQVAQHNTATDLWVIIKGKVYDVTSYVDEHPGGDAILRNAGRDSTEGFYGPQHPSRVFQILDDFLVGELAKESDKDK